MWRMYSWELIKKRRVSGLTIMSAALISALFLSLLCSLFFNLWVYNREAIILKEGDWQGRVIGTIGEEECKKIENFENVEKVVINKELSDEKKVVADIYFYNMRKIYQDMPKIIEKLGNDQLEVAYHETLLSQYMVYDPNDKQPPLLMAFALGVLVIVSISLILIIHNTFAVSMNRRIQQFGILSSIGATPAQIRSCLLMEAAFLCLFPILVGNLLGIFLGFGITEVINWLAIGVEERHRAVFQYHPLVFLITIMSSIVTVFISAWLPARKLGKVTPMRAIKNEGELQLKKKSHSHILAVLFGIEGELAGNALKAQKKAIKTSTLSLTLSFLGFTVMLCFFTLSGISTNHTYFERYQDTWDVMATIEDTKIEEFGDIEKIQAMKDVRSGVVYQKARTMCYIDPADISGEVRYLGGVEEIRKELVSKKEGMYTIEAPIIILDDIGFEEYCKQIGVEPEKKGGIVLNRIWDNKNSNFRYKKYVPFIKDNVSEIIFGNGETDTVKIPVISLTDVPPVLREEYDDYALVTFLPLSFWEKIETQFENIEREEDTYIRVLGREEITENEVDRMEEYIKNEVGKKYGIKTENRIREKNTDEKTRSGFMLILGAFCCLLALIGISNVFSNTLGFLYQRKREFIQYISIGMTKREMKKIFVAEAFVIAGRPVLITLPLTVVGVSFMIKASYIDPMEFIEKIPIGAILLFIGFIVCFVSLAYYIGGRRLLTDNLIEELQMDDVM